MLPFVSNLLTPRASATLLYSILFYSSVEEAVEVVEELKNSTLIFDHFFVPGILLSMHRND